MLPPDIEQRIRAAAKGDAEEFIRRLSAFAAENPEIGSRVLRCMVYISGGKLDQLSLAIQTAKLDWRDVIVSAEYDPKPGTKRWLGDYVQVRDFNRPFESNEKRG